jgi:predicted amidohydrolase
VLAEADDQIGIIVAQIDTAKVGEVRGRIPALKHTRNPKMPETAPA